MTDQPQPTPTQTMIAPVCLPEITETPEPLNTSAPTRRNTELMLLCWAVVITGVALLIVTTSLKKDFHNIITDMVSYILAFLVVFGCAHLVIRRFAPYADPLLLPAVAVLNGLGLVMIYRLGLIRGAVEATTSGSTDAQYQLVWMVVGIIGFCIVLIALGDYRSLARYSYLFGLSGLILLAIPALLPAQFSEVNGAKIWIRLPGFSIQPAEFSKIGLLIFFAAVLVSQRNLFLSAGVHILGITVPRPRDLAPLLIAWITAVVVMVVEKDLGTSLLLFTLFLVMVYIATQQFSWVSIGLTLFVIASIVAYQLFGHVQTRIQAWRDPFADPEGSGYQLLQAQFSFATGGIFGTGLGNGQPGEVPAASTDFILAAIGEELGFAGLAAVLIVYTIIIVRGLRTAMAIRDSFGKLLAAGVATILAIQLFIVVGGVTAVVPLTGLTTPWMSYGGSSLVANYFLLAILVRISDSARRPTHSATSTPLATAGTEVIERI